MIIYLCVTYVCIYTYIYIYTHVQSSATLELKGLPVSHFWWSQYEYPLNIPWTIPLPGDVTAGPVIPGLLWQCRSCNSSSRAIGRGGRSMDGTAFYIRKHVIYVYIYINLHTTQHVNTYNVYLNVCIHMYKIYVYNWWQIFQALGNKKLVLFHRLPGGF